MADLTSGWEQNVIEKPGEGSLCTLHFTASSSMISIMRPRLRCSRNSSGRERPMQSYRKELWLDAHIKRQVMGREVVVAITNGKLDFGPWEQIFYGEFDGRRKKRVLIKIIGE